MFCTYYVTAESFDDLNESLAAGRSVEGADKDTGEVVRSGQWCVGDMVALAHDHKYPRRLIWSDFTRRALKVWIPRHARQV